MFYLGLLMPIFYGLIPDEFIELVSPSRRLIAMVGGLDGDGGRYLRRDLRSRSHCDPVVTIVMGIGPAGEEGNTMGLCSEPDNQAHTSRRRSRWSHATAVGMATFLGTRVCTLLVGTEVTAAASPAPRL
jgi:hypothetical protein